MNVILTKQEAIEKDSKNMTTLGDKIYKRCNDWNQLNENYKKFEDVLNDIVEKLGIEEKKLAKKEFTYLTPEDVNKIKQLIEDAKNNCKKKQETTGKAKLINIPPVSPDEVRDLTTNLNENVSKIYADAKFKVEEEERKRKEEERKKNMLHRKQS